LPRHWKIRAVTLVELAALLGAEGKFAEAENLLRKDLVLREKFDGPRAPETAVATSNLATVLDETGKDGKTIMLLQYAKLYFFPNDRP
jgi:hypothetical protein